MNKHPLDPSTAKIRRAEAHIADLKDAIREFLASNPYRFVSNVNKKRSEEVWSIAVDPIPEKIECIAADAVHNLRTPLDKMLAAGFRSKAIHHDRAEIQKLKFPIAGSVNVLEIILSKLQEHLAGPVMEFLRSTEPYPGGKGQTLWAINQLDNRDKHRALLDPIKLGFSSTESRNIYMIEGLLLRLGSRNGKHLYLQRGTGRDSDYLEQADLSLRPILRLSPLTMNDYFLEFTSAHDDMEVFTTTPDAKVQANIKPALNIAFSETRGFEGEPVIQALEMMRSAVAGVLDAFRSAFF